MKERINKHDRLSTLEAEVSSPDETILTTGVGTDSPVIETAITKIYSPC
jgi:hypothetical protein